MSFVSHVNNTCLIPPAIKNPQASTTKTPDTLNPTRLALAPSAAAHTPQTAGVVTKISDGKPAESVTYTAPTQKKVSISDVAMGTLISAAGGVVGAGVGKYAAAKYENTLGTRVLGGVVGGAMGASFTPGNVFEIVGMRSDAGFILSACALVAGAVQIIGRPQQAQNLIPHVINNAPPLGPGIHA